MAQPIDPIHYKSSYTLAAERIRRAIELGTYLPGDRLPPSHELALQLGVSVATLREAVRGLIDAGLLEMRRGPQGGLVVLPQKRGGRQRVTKEALAELEQLVELRGAVEGESARLAAERRTDADLDCIEEAFQTMNDIFDDPGEEGLRLARFTRADSEFHGAIAAASRNELLQPVIDDTRARLFIALGLAVRELTPDLHKGHRQILDAIRRQRPEAATKAMRRHLDIAREYGAKAVSPTARSSPSA
ncbi:MAG: GntR family transcriptional regulator, transcriptional repressor for pyruvate dehydrogenase complex [Solirubrobacterales bacterium]|nr:GntR family transcriptional regulator, transcriptional repressor for pyruvate dehydrogenase complex [Solirubrobacterales bacterium]